MLVRCLLIVEQRSDAGVLLVINNLLLQDFQLKLHEMNLLLEVADVLVLNILIWVLAEGVILSFVLSSKLDCVCRFVTRLTKDSGVSTSRHSCCSGCSSFSRHQI